MPILLKSPLHIETDDDLVRVARDHAAYHFERDDEGTIIVSPTFSNGGFKSAEALGQLRDFAKHATAARPPLPLPGSQSDRRCASSPPTRHG